MGDNEILGWVVLVGSVVFIMTGIGLGLAVVIGRFVNARDEQNPFLNGDPARPSCEVCNLAPGGCRSDAGYMYFDCPDVKRDDSPFQGTWGDACSCCDGRGCPECTGMWKDL